MRLLVDCHCFDEKTTEGINTYIKGIYTEAPKLAPNIDFYFAARDVENIRNIFGKGKNIHYIQLSDCNKFYRLLLEFPRIIKKYNIDWAHYQYTAPLWKNCKTIVTLHDILFKDFPQYFPWQYRLIKGLTFKKSATDTDILCTVSNYSRDRIAYHFNITNDKIIVTPNAVSEEFKYIDGENAKKFVKNKGINNYILYVSRREPRKNQTAVLKAWKRLVDKNGFSHDLVFIGRPTIPLMDFNDVYNNLSITEKEHVHIIDNAPFSELKMWYKAASLFIYPALAEGFGIPPIEAAMAGVPVVCNNATAMGDFTFFGDNLVDITDEEKLDSSIENALATPFKPEIQDLILSRYNWQNSAQTLLSALISYKSM